MLLNVKDFGHQYTLTRTTDMVEGLGVDMDGYPGCIKDKGVIFLYSKDSALRNYKYHHLSTVDSWAYGELGQLLIPHALM